MRLSLSHIASLLSAHAASSNSEDIATGYSIDSRTVQPGELFFAVKGERLDGHDFLAQAFARGAIAAVVRHDKRDQFPDKARLVAVPDTLIALQTLAAGVRRLWAKPVIGITGSAGKTTTKETIAHLLATRSRVLKSEGNFNNQFGLPLTMLRLEPEHDVAVIEMGMSHAGEITELARIAQPNIGVVTCVAPVHLEFFASIEDIARAKYELIQNLPSDGIAVLNADDEYVSQFGRDFPGQVATFGIKHPSTVRAENIEPAGPSGSVFDIVAAFHRARATLPLLGQHNIYNALAAITVALERGIPLVEAVAALKSLVPADKRGQILQLNGVAIINDSYNSNPQALKAMVDTLAGMPADRRIVVAGEMLELGPTAPALHAECGRYMASRGIDIVIGVRGLAKDITESAQQAGVRSQFFETPEEAGKWLAKESRPGDAVLLKASRGVRLERALDTWKSRLPMGVGKNI